MDEKSTASKIYDLIAEQLDVSADLINRDTVAEDIRNWDSLKHAEIILAVEGAFDIEFEPSEIVQIDQVGTLIDFVLKKMPA